MDERINALISKLIQATQNKQISWTRISTIDFFMEEYSVLRYFISNKERNVYVYSNGKNFLNTSSSYITNYNGGNIYLLEYADRNTKKYTVALQSNNKAVIIELNDFLVNQSELMSLKYFIEQNVDNVEDYLNLLIENL
ncbi:MAG: hypothetical protein H7Y41_00785 [Hyphomonadaceae bacterium]|nr:hypothetical protein [Clostridia bacterium]